MLETAGMVNMNMSVNHQAALEQPAGSSRSSKDPKKLARQRSDKNYREKKKVTLYQFSVCNSVFLWVSFVVSSNLFILLYHLFSSKRRKTSRERWMCWWKETTIWRKKMPTWRRREIGWKRLWNKAKEMFTNWRASTTDYLLL